MHYDSIMNLPSAGNCEGSSAARQRKRYEIVAVAMSPDGIHADLCDSSWPSYYEATKNGVGGSNGANACCDD